MNKSDIHYLNCMDDNCEVISCVGRREYERKMGLIYTLFDVIKHGDKDHQDWLENKIKEHFDL